MGWIKNKVRVGIRVNQFSEKLPLHFLKDSWIERVIIFVNINCGCRLHTIRALFFGLQNLFSISILSAPFKTKKPGKTKKKRIKRFSHKVWVKPGIFVKWFEMIRQSLKKFEQKCIAPQNVLVWCGYGFFVQNFEMSGVNIAYCHVFWTNRWCFVPTKILRWVWTMVFTLGKCLRLYFNVRRGTWLTRADRNRNKAKTSIICWWKPHAAALFSS